MRFADDDDGIDGFGCPPGVFEAQVPFGVSFRFGSWLAGWLAGWMDGWIGECLHRSMSRRH